MVYRPPEPDHRDTWGPLIIVFIGFLIVLSLGGCAHIREDQKQKDIKIIDFALSNYQWTLRNPHDRNTLNRLRWEIRRKINNAD